MNRNDNRYSQFALTAEMLNTVETVRAYRTPGGFAPRSREVFVTGEGSSRIFPAKHLIYQALSQRYPFCITTDGGDQACEYDLTGKSVFVASNSGRTAECVRLIQKLKAQGHDDITGVSANSGSPVTDASDRSYVLSCGTEKAVAATVSVVEQALFYDLLFREAAARPVPDLGALADAMAVALQMEIPADLVGKLASSRMLLFAGRNDGVAEELALKTNEIARKTSGYLEGSYAVHGIEEVLTDKDVVVVIDPFEEEEEKFHEVLEKGVGLQIIAVSHRDTRFPTVKLPAAEAEPGTGLNQYVQLAAGWNLLVETGLALGIDLDRPVRARKVGNEFG